MTAVGSARAHRTAQKTEASKSRTSKVKTRSKKRQIYDGLLVFFAALKQRRPNFFAMRGQKDNQKPENTEVEKRARFIFTCNRNKLTTTF